MIKPIDQTSTTEKLLNTVAVGIIGAEAARYIHYNSLTDTAKFAMRNVGKTKDTFVKEAVKCAYKTKHDFPKSGINLRDVRQRAVNIYPKLESLGNRVSNRNKTIGLIAAGVFTLGAALYNFVIKPHHQAEQ